MKIWGVLCFLGFITELNAHNIDNSDREEKGVVGVASHPDEDSHKESSGKDHKAELSSFGKGNSESPISAKEEKAEPYMIVGGDKPSPPGGGVLLLDPKVVNEMILPPFAEPEVPWWERWWNGMTTWLFGESS